MWQHCNFHHYLDSASLCSTSDSHSFHTLSKEVVMVNLHADPSPFKEWSRISVVPSSLDGHWFFVFWNVFHISWCLTEKVELKLVDEMVTLRFHFTLIVHELIKKFCDTNSVADILRWGWWMMLTEVVEDLFCRMQSMELFSYLLLLDIMHYLLTNLSLSQQWSILEADHLN
jgi:hypothetical protein